MAGESDLWTECKEYVRHAHGGRLKKVEPAGDNGFPDGLVMLPNTVTLYAEFKNPKGGVMRKRQDYWRRWLIANGFQYYKVNDFYEFCEFIDGFVEDHKRG